MKTSGNLNYPLAKVVENYLSKDGHAGIVKMKMKGGKFQRPVLRMSYAEDTCDRVIRLHSITRDSISPEQTV